MFSKLTLSLSAVSLLAAACGSSPTESTSHAGQAVDQGVVADAAFTGCTVDADCMAVQEAGCCNNGWMVAVSVDHACDYADANACTVQNQMCPSYQVNDTRVAECNITTKACEMVAIADIKCKGFIANAHQCPDGYTCQLNPQFGGDIPGSCVAAPSGGSAGDDGGTTAN
jgi:hypothetical protein